MPTSNDIDNKNRILLRYLNDLYISEIKEFKDKTWTRESDLDNRQLERDVLLREALTHPEDCTKLSKRIIVFRGEQVGDGKQFYLRKLVETCFNAIPPFTWNIMESEYLIPVIVKKETLEDALQSIKTRDISANELAESCFLKKLEPLRIKDSNQQRTETELAKELSRKGRLILFLRTCAIEVFSSIAERLVFSESTENGAPPLIFLTTDKDFISTETVGNNSCHIDIDPLSNDQILRYIAMEIPECSGYLEHVQKPETFTLLRKQERLLKMVDIWKDSDKDNLRKHLTRLYIEKDFIDSLLRENPNLRQKLHEAAANTVFKEHICDDILKDLKKTKWFSELFYDNGEFKYEESKFYLLAEKLYNEYFPEITPTLATINEPLKKSLDSSFPAKARYYFASLLLEAPKPKVYPRDYFKKILEILEGRQDVSIPAELINTMKGIDKIESGLNAYCDWMTKSLSGETYDENIFEELKKLTEDSVNYSKNLQTVLKDKYLSIIKKATNKNSTEDEKSRILRRMVYLFSRLGIPLPDDIIDDLFEQNSTDIHLYYHIVSALIDTANIIDKDISASIIQRSEKSVVADTILQLELNTLTHRLNPKAKQPFQNKDNIIDQVLLILQNDDCEYWKKAHAAGALGRYQTTDLTCKTKVITALLALLGSEIKILEEGRDHNHLKTVSYIIQAIHTILINNTTQADDLINNTKTEIEGLLSQYIPMILSSTVSHEVYDCLHSALSLLLCGLIHIVLKPFSDIRKDLGQLLGRGSSSDALLSLKNIQALELDDSLLENIYNWIEIHKSPLPSQENDCTLPKKYAASVGRIYVGGSPAGMGFLVRKHNSLYTDVYCVTCRHQFKSVKDFSDITIQPIGSEGGAKYSLALRFPQKNSDMTYRSRKEDYSIWIAYGVPRTLLEDIYSVDNFSDSKSRQKMTDRLWSFAFPKVAKTTTDEENGKSIYYEFKDHLRTSWSLICYENENDSTPTDKEQQAGYSGTAIANKSGDEIIAMHQGSWKADVECLPADDIRTQIEKQSGWSVQK